MISNYVEISVFNSSDEAPKYPESVKLLKVRKCLVIGKGMTSGAPTADIQLVDEEGNEYLVMATCSVVETMGIAVRTKREMDQGR